MSKATDEDNQWAWNRMSRQTPANSLAWGSYRYRDPAGVVHRGVWDGGLHGQWLSVCGERIVDKLQEDDVGAITCVRCLGCGA